MSENDWYRDIPQGSGGIAGDEGTTVVQRGFLRRLLEQKEHLENTLRLKNGLLENIFNGLTHDGEPKDSKLRDMADAIADSLLEL